MRLEALDVAAPGVDVVVIAEHADPAILVEHALHLAIHRLALVLVELAASLNEKLVEALALPLGLVPRAVALIGRGQHEVCRRPRVPSGNHERLFHPDRAPVRTCRGNHHLDVESGSLGGFLVEQRDRIRPVSGLLGGMQFDRRSLHAGLLQVELSLVRIVRALRNVVAIEGIGGRDLMVVADHPEPLEDILDDPLARNQVLQRKPKVLVVGRRAVAHHDQVDMLTGLRVDQFNPRRLPDQVEQVAVH